MATTIRTIEYPDGEIFISAYDGTDGVAILRASGGHHSVSFELNRTEVQQLISALLDVMATLPNDGPSTDEEHADAVWAELGSPENIIPAVKELRERVNLGLWDSKHAILAAKARAEARAKAARNADREGQS